jgi:hypothetical protein
VTVTSPDGAESAELVSYDQASAADIERLLDELVAKVQPQLGTTPELTLLGLLADRLLDRASAPESSKSSLREATR